MVVWLLSVFLATHVSQAIHLQHDLENYMQDLDFMEEDSAMILDTPDTDLGFEDNAFWSSEGDDEGVRRMWGVPDTSVTIGELLNYQIPKDAFVGPVERYIVKGKESALPSWMHFDETTNTLEGIPTGTDIGAHFVKVFGVGPSPGSKAKDTFVVEVMPSIPSVPEIELCSDSRISVFNLLLDVSLEKMNGKQRAALLRKTARFLPVPEKQMRLVREEDLGSLLNDVEMSDSGMVGPGDTPRKNHNGAVLQWQVGCDGRVANEKELRNLAESAKDGTLHEVTGFPVVGWYINAVNILLSRESREVGSGDDDPYEDSTDEMPASRSVVSLATPVHHLEQPVSPHPHRHGHERRNSATPAYYAPASSTPALEPIMPTTVMGSNIPEPTMSYSAIDSSMIDFDIIEPSLLFTPSLEVTETEPLSSDVIASTREPSSVTDFIELGAVNFPPSIVQRLTHKSVEVGEEYRFQIPKGTFGDLESGIKLELELKDKNHQELHSDSWLQFHRTKEEIYGLPLQQDIGKWTYQLYAYDEERKYVNDSLVIRVQQASNTRKKNHKFSLTFLIHGTFENDVLWKLDVLNRLATLFGDSSTENMTVEEVKQWKSKNKNYVMSWRNSSLTEGCPRTDIIRLYKVLSDDSPEQRLGKPTKDLQNALAKEFEVKSVNMELMKEFCNNVDKPGKDGKSIAPVLENPIDEITAVVGEMLNFQVPVDTFTDTEDGLSDSLNLTLIEMSYGVLNKSSWLQFDSRNRLFFGIPIESDIGTTEYNLKCTDKHGKSESDALQVIVKPRNDSDTVSFSAQFSISISYSWQAFNSDGSNRVKIVEKLAKAFGDTSPNHIVVKSIKQGSVVFAWYNRSLPVAYCPTNEIEQLRRVMLNDNSELTDSFTKIFKPVFELSHAEVKPMGICLGGDTPTDGTVVSTDSAIQDHREEEEDHLITYIVPAIVIAIMILIAAIIAFILYRKRSRQGKMTMVDNKTYLSKGIPIIFAEELEDKPEPPKNPVIMKDEKPPLPPPEYPRGTPKPDEELEDYQPPPPFTRDSNRQNRPKATPTYRKPPPYVPP